MSAEQKKGSKNEVAPEKKDYCTRVLLNEEEWNDPICRVVVGENYKEGLKVPPSNIESDLDAFGEIWKEKGAENVKAEYHKENAPHLEDSPKGEGRPEPREVSGGRAAMPKSTEPKVRPQEPVAEAKTKVESDPSTKTLDRPIDLAGIEVISYALFRFIFGTGVHIPIKREGMVDMDVTVKRKDIIVNTNQLFGDIPDLVVWRIIYTHKGKPIFEMGRGVKNGLKVHKFQAIKLGIEIWRLSRASRKAKERAAKAALLKEGEN